MTDNKERDAFETWLKERPYANFADYAWAAWQARAALAASQEKAEPVAYAVTSISEAWTDFYTASEKDAIPESFDDGTRPVVTALYAAPVAAQASEPSTPDLTSTVINDACWKFIEAMPHSLPGPIFNELKPALYAAVCHVLTNTAPQPSAEVVRNSERYLWLRDQTSTDEIAIVMKNKCINDLISYAENIDSYIDRALKSAPLQPAEHIEADDTCVICPGCAHQFRAIPVQVQSLMLAAGFEPPFTDAPKEPK